MGVLMLAWGLLKTDWGKEQARKLLVWQINEQLKARLEVGRLSGDLWTGLRAENVRIIQNGETVIRVKSLSTGYALLDALGGTLHVTDLSLENLYMKAIQRPDSSWNLLDLVKPQPKTGQKSQTTLRFDRVSVRNGSGELVGLPAQQGGAPRTGTLQQFDFTARNLRYTEPDFVGEIPRLQLTARLPERTDEVQLLFSGKVITGAAHIEDFRLTSARSRVSAKGYAEIPVSGHANHSNFTLSAAPFAFADIAPFAPFLNPDQTLNAEVRIYAPDKDQWALLTKGQFSQGGAWDLTAEAQLDPPSFQPKTYSISGNVEHLNLAYLMLDRSYTSDVTANINGQFSGTEPNTMHGEVLMNWKNGSSFQGKNLQAGSLRIAADAGDVQFELGGGWDGMGLMAKGTARPFEEQPNYTVRGQFSGVNPAKFDPTMDYGTYAGTFSVQGTGFDPEKLQTSGTLQLQPTTFRWKPYSIPLRQTQLQFALKQRAGTFSASSYTAADGFASAKGTFLLDEPMQFRVDRGQIRQFDPRAVLGESFQRGNLNATFTVDGRGTDPKTMQLSVLGNVQASRYDAYRLDTANFSTNLNNGVLKYETRAEVDGSNVRLVGHATPFATRPMFEVSDGVISHLNLDPFFPDQNMTSDLNGHFKIRAIDLDKQQIEADLDLWPSRYMDYDIRVLRGTIRVDQDRLGFGLHLDSGFGQADVQGTARPFDRQMSVEITQGVLRDFDLQSIFPASDMPTRLNARIEQFTASGTDAQDAEARLRLQLLPSVINRQEISGGKLTADVLQGKVVFEADVTPENGQLRLTGSGLMDGAEPVYQFSGTTENLDVSRLLNPLQAYPSTLNTQFQLQGRGYSAESGQLSGSLSMRNSRMLDVQVSDLVSRFQYENGGLRLDSLSLRSNVGTLDGRGNIMVYDNLTGEESDFSFTGNLQNLAPLSAFAGDALTGHGLIRGSVRGAVNAWRVRMESVNEGLSLLGYGTLHLGRAKGRFTIEFEDGKPTWASRGEAENIAIPGYVFENSTYEVSMTDSTVQFSGRAKLDDRLSGSGSGTVVLKSDGYALDLQDLQLKLGANAWKLRRASRMTWRADEVAVSEFRFESGNQRVIANGVLARQATSVPLNLSLTEVDVTDLADLLQFNGLSGKLSGRMDLSGTLDNPVMDGNIFMTNMLSSGVPIGSMQGAVAYADARMRLDLTLNHIENQDLKIQGTLPFNLGRLEKPLEGPVNVTLSTRNFNLNWGNPFFEDTFLNKLNGRLSGDMTITGTFDDPNFQGGIQLRDAGFQLPFLGVAYQNTKADVTFNKDQAVIQQLSTQSEGGSLTGSGTISLSRLNLGYLDLVLDANKFPLIKDNTFHVIASGKATLRGTTDRPILDGEAVLNTCEVYLNAELMQTAREAVQLSDQDLREIEAQFGRQATATDTSTVTFYDATDVNLKIRSNGNTWLRSRYNPRMDIEMTGDLEFRKPYRNAEVIFGKLAAVPGRSRVEFGRQFDITTGEIVFNGELLNPLMNIKAEYKAGSASRGEEQKITMEISGDVNNTQFRFVSDPPMEDTEILSFLAFGRAAQNAFSLDTTGNGGVVNDLLSTYGYSLVESLLSQRAQDIGIDMVDVSSEDGQPALKIGKYISRRFFIALDSKLGSGSPGYLLEYQARKWAILRLQQFPSTLDQQDRTLGLYVLLEYSY